MAFNFTKKDTSQWNFLLTMFKGLKGDFSPSSKKKKNAPLDASVCSFMCRNLMHALKHKILCFSRFMAHIALKHAKIKHNFISLTRKFHNKNAYINISPL